MIEPCCLFHRLKRPAPPTLREAGEGHSGCVILLNGPSSAGKSTMARSLKHAMNGKAVMLSMDDCLSAHRQHYANALSAAAAEGMSFIQAFHKSIESAARRGAMVVADHVAGESPVWVDDLFSRLSGIPTACVRVHCRADILLSREESRTDRTPDTAHAMRQHRHIHRHFPHDFSVDTSDMPPAACALALLRHLPALFLHPFSTRS